MGTNFYLAGRPADANGMDPAWHIGKRSAAGPYCWDCQKTLCVEGNTGIHASKSVWLKSCFQCGAKPDPSDGFRYERKGVDGCCSFTWAMDPEVAKANAIKRVHGVVDSNGTKMTWSEFEVALKDCPIQFRQYGEWFC